MKFVVFGLGNFGAALCEQLVQLGHEVIGVDHRMEKVDKFKHTITHTIALDATSREAVEQLPISDVDAAIVGIGEDEGANIMTTALLKQMGVKRIISRITSPLQRVVLEAMALEEFVNPEVYSAERLALKLDMPGVIDSFKVTNDYRLLEVSVPRRYAGDTIAELNLGSRYGLVLVTVMKKMSRKNIFGNEHAELQVMGVVPEDTLLDRDDILLLFGSPKDLERFVGGKK